jgi:hypothetical protein
VPSSIRCLFLPVVDKGPQVAGHSVTAAAFLNATVLAASVAAFWGYFLSQALRRDLLQTKEGALLDYKHL